MPKKIAIVILAFALIGACVFGAGFVAGAGKNVGGFQQITDKSACPAVGCASGSCHGFNNVPEPDGTHEMNCPESTCSSVECHAWDTLVAGKYGSANDASLNLWIIFPVVLVLGLVLITRKVK